MTRRPFAVGLVLGLALGVVLGGAVAISTPVRSDDDVTHVHASSRFDRPTLSLVRELRRIDKHTRAGIVTWTETSRLARSRALRQPGWHRLAAPRRTDVALSYASGWQLRRGSVRLLTDARYYRQNGTLAPQQRALFALLRRERDGLRVLVAVVHLPAHVQFGNDFRRDVPRRVKVWRTGLDGLAREVRRATRATKPDLVIVTGDWNVSVRRPVWRARVVEPFDGLRLTWRREHLPAAGTHRGGRLIDATLTNARGRARLLRWDRRASDHVPFIERLTGH